MIKSLFRPGAMLSAALLLAVSMGAQPAFAEGTFTVAPDGSVTINNAVVPLSSLMSEGSKQVLMRTHASEGPGAPVPLPANVKDIKDIRRIYNDNLKPMVDHMREVFPVDIKETTIDGISAAIITPKGGVPERNRNRLILNGPGGGFRTGVRGNGLLISIPMAATLGVKVVSILYRQGPEYRFPAASEDLLKVWNHFTKTYKPKNIGMLGCSAGGVLITETTAILIKEGRPTPGVLGVYCSGIGAQFGGDSRFYGRLTVTNVAKAVESSKEAPAAVRGNPAAPGPANPAERLSYFTGIDMNQFTVNPLVNEKLLAKFPPTIFFTATRDMAMSGAAISNLKLQLVGVPTQIMVFDGLYHGFMTNPDFPESREGYAISAKFFDKYLGH